MAFASIESCFIQFVSMDFILFYALRRAIQDIDPIPTMDFSSPRDEIRKLRFRAQGNHPVCQRLA
jgi:hypothetical protein